MITTPDTHMLQSEIRPGKDRPDVHKNAYVKLFPKARAVCASTALRIMDIKLV
jgi:hypothetical protein